MWVLLENNGESSNYSAEKRERERKVPVVGLANLGVRKKRRRRA